MEYTHVKIVHDKINKSYSHYGITADGLQSSISSSEFWDYMKPGRKDKKCKVSWAPTNYKNLRNMSSLTYAIK